MDDDEVNMTTSPRMTNEGPSVVVAGGCAIEAQRPQEASRRDLDAGPEDEDADGDVAMSTSSGSSSPSAGRKAATLLADQPMETSSTGTEAPEFLRVLGEDEDREHQRTAAQLRAMAVSTGRAGSPAVTLGTLVGNSNNSNDGAGSSSNNSNNGFASALSNNGIGESNNEDEFADADTRMTRTTAISGEDEDDGRKCSVGTTDESSCNAGAGERQTGTNEDNKAVYADKDRLKPFVKTCAKFNLSGGSGSGDHDGMVSMEDGTDGQTKKRKTRRGKPKHRKLKPYSKTQQPFQQRTRGRGASGRPTKTMRQGQPLAPNNTTQFIIEDHHELEDLEQRLSTSNNDGPAASNGPNASNFTKPAQLARTRDSSFSVDSDDDFFYSSPEDEDEFLTKEFSTAYEDVHAERLSGLSKGELIQEYLALEAKVESLAKRLRKSQNFNNQQQLAQNAIGDAEGTVILNPEATRKQLRVYQQKIDELIHQNEHLRRENDVLKQRLGRAGSPMSSVDSESDSDSKCCSANSECSCNQPNKSPGSSPVPSSYNANRPDKPPRKRNANSVSSVDSESDSTSTTTEGEPDYEDGRRKTGTGPTSPNGELSNGHAASHELIGLPT